MVSSQNSGCARQRISKIYTVIGSVILKIKLNEQQNQIVRIFRTKMNKVDINYENTDPGDWEDCYTAWWMDQNSRKFIRIIYPPV